MTDFQELPITDIHPDPNQPRKIFDEDALVALADSIKEHGLQPIGVPQQPWLHHQPRRAPLACSQLAGLTTIRAIIGEQPDALRRRIRHL